MLAGPQIVLRGPREAKFWVVTDSGDKTVADEELEPVEAGSQAPSTPSRSGVISIAKTLAFVSVIVVVEVVAASMLAPSAAETARLGQDLTAAATGKLGGANDKHDHGESSHGEADEMYEVELGIYNITRFNPATETTLAIDFELFGTVLASDKAEFEHEFEKNKARFREQVTLTLHGAESADLTDAGLGLIKRQILEKTNRALGQPLLKEVLFSKFSFVER
jgi:flagellar FliL protein